MSYDLVKAMNDIENMMKKENVKIGNIADMQYSDKLHHDTWGVCRRHKTSSKVYFTIEINRDLGYEENEYHLLLETILHEMIHTITGCFNHGTKFKTIGRKFDKYGYNVNTYSEKKLNRRTLPKKHYKIICKDCGEVYIYQRKTKTVKNIISGLGCCGRCMGDIKVIYCDGNVNTVLRA